jgi:MFS family permease
MSNPPPTPGDRIMFITLLLVTFVISLAVSTIVVYFFNKPIQLILGRVLMDDISKAWARYLYFAIYVVGVSSGVRIWELEKYITPATVSGTAAPIPELTQDRWVLEVYRTIIESLQGLAWLLLVFFIIALGAFIVVRIVEMVKAQKSLQPEKPPVVVHQ